ncbi:MAG: hypothetical protein JO322_08835 [Candidatus Eremiobacteraeota bacterium]|nr:hypothetical protein [Candidatus Eremiobacteraeota bacterium]
MLLALTLAAALDASAFAYDSKAPLHAVYGMATPHDGVAMRTIRFASAGGRIVHGMIVEGNGNAMHPVVLFVHWLGDEATTNHTEFQSDAAYLARRGVTSLLIDAMWSQKDWFEKGRSTQTDYERSIEQVVDLRRSLDALLTLPNVDANRIAYVGHDFGSMYGAVLAGIDGRPQWYVLMAGTTSFSEWYLLGQKPPDVQGYIAQMAPLDPGNYLARSKARAFLFQFSSRDRYVTPDRELAFFEAAPLPRTMAIYDVDHSLATPAAAQDRLAWLAEKLHL